MNKRTTLALALALSFTACSGQGSNKEASTSDPISPKTRLVRGRHHKVLVDGIKKTVRDELHAKNAVVRDHDYGSYWVLAVDEFALGGREEIERLPVTLKEDFNLIRIDGYPINTIDPEQTLSALPTNLKKDRVGRALTRGVAPSGGLFLMQLEAPIKDDWRAAIEGDGFEIVSYVPENAYVVRASDRVARSIPRVFQRFDFIQFIGDYEPAFKIAPALRNIRAGNKVELTVQLIKNEDVKRALAAVEEMSTEKAESWDAGQYLNVAITTDAAKIADLANLDDVFAIDQRTNRRRLDEAQGQIVAGNLTGNAPTGPGYQAFVDGKGFSSSQFQTFVVEVVDDSHSITGHPDLPTSRVVFQNNPTGAGSTQDGHGFLNTHIIGGVNNGTGTAVEDALGFNYGLGIAPYARMGVTDIFGPGFATPTTWENTAYGSGARVSSNSWGFIFAFRYDTNAQEYDRIVRDAQTATGLQQLIVAFAAGNDGPGANSIGSPGTAKNVITVGASENVRQTGTDGCAVGNTGANSANDVIDFSSRGPVNSSGGDGRIKPDIVAPGTHIQAGVPQSSYTGASVCNQYWPSGQTLYGWSSGTSHSCPAVAGGAALVYQDFINKALPTASPAMVKAYLMNSAAYMTGTFANDTLPSNSQGMGRMDLGRMFDGSQRMFVDQTTVFGATGETSNVTGTVANTALPFRVTLAWTDAPGPTTGAPWINNLDLTVTVGGNTYNGNVFTGASSATGGTADTRNNVESVFLPAGTSGNFTVTVRATNVAGDGVPGNADTTDQDFALVIYNGSAAVLPPAIGVSPSSMSFSGTAGGSNPAAQTLTISNTGGGTLNWTATTNQTWLSISAASGTAPSTPSVSVNTTGLAAGTYNGAVTVSATGATNSPVTVPVTLTVTAPTPPTIAPSPASMSFVATAGGANPASQTLTVNNSGGGTFTWSAATNQTWLTVNPTSGNAGGTTSVSANITGLAAGTYNANITITAAGATNSPANVPVTLTVNSATGPELIVNGGFETQILPWVRNGTGQFWTANGSSPHAGTGFAYFGSTTNNAAGLIGQQFSVPAGSTASLSYWLRITTNETGSTANDNLFVEIRNTSGVVLATLASYSNLNAAAFGSYAQQSGFSLAPWAGQTIRVYFRVTTNASTETTFYLDDVSVR